MRHRRRLISLLILPLCGASVVRAQQTPPASPPPVQDNAPSPHLKNKPQSASASVGRLQLVGPRGQDVETICQKLPAALGSISSLSKTQFTLIERSSTGETSVTYLLTEQPTGTGILEKGAWVRVCYREAEQKRTAVVIEVLEPAPATTDAAVGTLKKGNSRAGNKPPDEDSGQLPSPPGGGQKGPSHVNPPGPGGPETAGERGNGDDGNSCAGTPVARGLVTSVSATGLVLEENTPHGARQSAYVRGPQTKENGTIRPGVRAVICYSESAGKRTALFIASHEPD